MDVSTIDRARAGDAEAFGRIYAYYRAAIPPLHGRAAARLRPGRGSDPGDLRAGLPPLRPIAPRAAITRLAISHRRKRLPRRAAARAPPPRSPGAARGRRGAG